MSADADAPELDPQDTDGRSASRHTERDDQFRRWIAKLREQVNSGADSATPVYVPASFFENGFLPSTMGVPRHDGCVFVSLGTARATLEEREEEIEQAITYVRENFAPPLPDQFGRWVVELRYRVRNGTRADAEVPLPADVLTSTYRPRQTRATDKGEVFTTLAEALELLHLDEELQQARDHVHVPTSITIKALWPAQALTLANTADAETVAAEFEPELIAELAEALTTGTWPSGGERVEMDDTGRLTTGLAPLLAIIKADTYGKVAFHNPPSDPPRPLAWRGPAGSLIYDPRESP